MNTDRIVVIGAVLTLGALLVWLDIRREVSRWPELKKLAWWQMLAMYMGAWLVIGLMDAYLL